MLEARAAPTKAMKPMMAEVTMAQNDLPKYRSDSVCGVGCVGVGGGVNERTDQSNRHID